MKFSPHFLRITAPPLAALMLIIVVAAIRPVCASTPEAESRAERYVLERLQARAEVDLTALPEDQRELRGTFIERLLTSSNTNLKTGLHPIIIQNALITGNLFIEDQEVTYDVSFRGCAFKDSVSFNGSRFSKNLEFNHCYFESWVDFSDVAVGEHFRAYACGFRSSEVVFDRMRVRRDFRMERSTFNTRSVSFAGARVEGAFSVDESTFNSDEVSFDDMRTADRFSVQRCLFSRAHSLGFEEGSRVGFEGAHFGDFFLNETSFEWLPTVDFTRLEADFISFDGIKFKTPTGVKVQRMTFKLISPANAEQLQFLLNTYNAEFYNDLENSFRTHGYPDEGDKVFIAKKRAERRENCKDFWRQCNRGRWAFSLFEDMLAGYGKSLQNLLYWSLGFLIIGTFVFRSEKGMRTKDAKEAEHSEGKYNPFWYSLDLFLPIIKLGEADVWTPKDYRRWAHLYRKVHIIIGSLFVPIGLAAWTGIIK